MKGKKFFALLVVLVMTISLAACGDSTSTDKDSTGDKAAKKDGDKMPTYIAATEPTFPPFDTTDDNGNIVGFDMDLMNAIGKDQGFKVEYKPFEFDTLIPAVQAGNADMITAGMNAEDPARQAQVDFSNTYYDSGLVVIVKEDNDTIKGIDDLKPNMKVASQIGTTGASEASELQKKGKIKEAVILNGFDTCMLQVINGDVNAVIIDQPVGKAYLKKQPGKVKIVGNVLNAESYGFAVKKGNKELLDKINAGLANVKKDGTYDTLFKKWFE